MKRRKKSESHVCPICEPYHPRCRQWHGHYVAEVRRYSAYTLDKKTTFGSWTYRRAMDALLAFERRLADLDRRCKERDRWDASYRGSKRKFF